MSLASKTIDEKNFLLAAGAMGVDISRRVNQVDASHVVISDLGDCLRSVATVYVCQ